MSDVREKFTKAAAEISANKKSIRECVHCAFVDHLSDINVDDLPWEIQIFYESVKMRLSWAVPPGGINDNEAAWIAEDILYMADVLRNS